MQLTRGKKKKGVTEIDLLKLNKKNDKKRERPEEEEFPAPQLEELALFSFAISPPPRKKLREQTLPRRVVFQPDFDPPVQRTLLPGSPPEFWLQRNPLLTEYFLRWGGSFFALTLTHNPPPPPPTQPKEGGLASYLWNRVFGPGTSTSSAIPVSDNQQPPKHEAAGVPEGFIQVPNRAEGDCLFESLAYFLKGDTERHAEVRKEIYEQIKKDQGKKELPDYLEDEKDVLAEEGVRLIDWIETVKKPKEWGGTPEIIAAYRRYHCYIAVYSYANFQPQYYPAIAEACQDLPQFFAIYHSDISGQTHLPGRGNHYTSLIPGSPDDPPPPGVNPDWPGEWIPDPDWLGPED